MDADTREFVRRRAGNRCEYCLIPQEFDELPFQIDHVIARKHQGSNDPSNLAWACFACNNHKGPNLSGVEAGLGEIVRLFHPRTDVWRDHFAWEGALLRGRTAIGRVTIEVLRINRVYRIDLRTALIDEGVFP